MKKLLGLLGAVLLVSALIVVFVYVKINKPYSDIINMNWSIKLSNSYKEIYSKDSGASFHGDGDRYHIFQYTNDNDIIQALSLESSKNETIELDIKEVIETLGVSKEYIPNFQNEYKYCTKTKEDNSKIYFIFIADAKKLYIIERIL